jgi:GNAT superfamily N-acetyltransferase
VKPGAGRPVYYEPARSYTAVWVVLAAFAAACVFDVVRSGRLVHLAGWALGAVVVAGIILLAIRTARALRSITVTESDLVVGEAVLPRSSIAGVERSVDAKLPVLGQSMPEGLPRGAIGLGLQLVDGGRVLVPTRRPDRLAAVLSLPPEAEPARPAEPDDLPLLADVERSAVALYRVRGTPLPEMWTATDDFDDALAVFVVGRPPFGFIRLVEIDGLPNISAIALVPKRVRGGVGRRLLDRACTWARAQGYAAITVTAYAETDWNAPFFAACGFVETTEYGPGMVELRDWEHAIGLDAVGRRVVMRRELQVP